MKRKKIPLKFDFRRLDHVRVIGSKNGQDLIIAEAQKYKKPVFLKAHDLKKNPNKIWIWKPKKGTPFSPQAFTYKGFENWVHIANSGVCVDLPLEIAVQIAQAIIKYNEELEYE